MGSSPLFLVVIINCLFAYSSLGQNLSTSTYVGEIVFAIIIATVGLVLFALLIGNMQVNSTSFLRFNDYKYGYTNGVHLN